MLLRWTTVKVTVTVTVMLERSILAQAGQRPTGRVMRMKAVTWMGTMKERRRE
jgi:hypothetical protein